jgi:4-amino-4-deoxy-L-arabinose transferase-like glycosyltransferase
MLEEDSHMLTAAEAAVTSAREPRRQPGALIRALVCLLLAAVTLTPYLLTGERPIWVDEGLYSYMARVSYQEHLPFYQAGHENKPPGIYLLYRWLHGFDLAGVYRVRLAEGVMLYLVALLLLWWWGREVSPLAGVVAAFGLVLLAVPQYSTYALTEVPLILFTVPAFWLVWNGLNRRRPGYLALAGLALAAAASFKQVAVFDFAAAVLFVALAREYGVPRERLRWALLLAGTFAAGLLALALLMVATHQWHEFLEDTVWSVLHGSASPHGQELGLLPGLRRLWSTGPEWGVPLGLAVATLLLPFTGALRVRRRMVGLWLPCTLVGFCGAGTLYAHHFIPALPALCLMAGLGADWAQRRLARQGRWGVIALTVLLLAAWSPALRTYQGRLKIDRRHAYATLAVFPGQVGDWLNQHLPPDATIYVLGDATQIYANAQRRAPTRYFFSETRNTYVPPLIMRDLRAAPPAALIFTPGSPGLNAPLRAAIRDWPAFRTYRLVRLPYPGDYQVYLRPDVAATVPG